MENVRAHFRDRREDLHSRYRQAKSPEEGQKIIRDMQKFNMEARNIEESSRRSPPLPRQKQLCGKRRPRL